VGKTLISTYIAAFNPEDTPTNPKILRAIPTIRAGTTKDKACIIIKDTTPTLLSPKVLNTANSKFLVSIDTNKRLYKSIKLSINKINTIMLRITPKNMAPNLNSNNSDKTGRSIYTGYTPKSLAILLATYEI